MAVSIPGIIVNVVLGLVGLFTLALGFMFKSHRQQCETHESPFCYTVSCPCDDPKKGPCFGYTKRPGPKAGTYVCSNALNSVVDINGKVVT